MKLINYGYFYERLLCPHWLFTDVYGRYHCYLYIRKKGKNNTYCVMYYEGEKILHVRYYLLFGFHSGFQCEGCHAG